MINMIQNWIWIRYDKEIKDILRFKSKYEKDMIKIWKISYDSKKIWKRYDNEMKDKFWFKIRDSWNYTHINWCQTMKF